MPFLTFKMLYKILNASVNLACTLYLKLYAAVTYKYIDVQLGKAARALEEQMKEAVVENKRQILLSQGLLIDSSEVNDMNLTAVVRKLRTKVESLETKVNAC